jgi:hypothetical protein
MLEIFWGNSLKLVQKQPAGNLNSKAVSLGKILRDYTQDY